MRQTLVEQPQEERKLTYHFPISVMPEGVTLIEVIALAEAVQQKGSFELSDLARLFSRFSSPHLLSILRATQLLGLIQRDGGVISPTDLGIGFSKASDGKEAIMRAGLRRIEPFKTALELLSKKKTVTAQEVTETLLKKNDIIRANQMTNEESVRTILVEWGMSLDLFAYNAKTFSLFR